METKYLKVHLGAGKDIKQGWVNVDRHPFPGIDIVCDIANEKLPFEDGSVDYIYSQDFLEHIPPEKKMHVINEMWRILRPECQMEHYMPNAGSKNDFGSPSHLSHWSLQQFDHFDVNSYRYEKDREYEGFIGAFEKVLAEERTLLLEDQGYKYQSIHVIYKKLNVPT